jgi:hypothetical protein
LIKLLTRRFLIKNSEKRIEVPLSCAAVIAAQNLFLRAQSLLNRTSPNCRRRFFLEKILQPNKVASRKCFATRLHMANAQNNIFDWSKGAARR